MLWGRSQACQTLDSTPRNSCYVTCVLHCLPRIKNGIISEDSNHWTLQLPQVHAEPGIWQGPSSDSSWLLSVFFFFFFSPMTFLLNCNCFSSFQMEAVFATETSQALEPFHPRAVAQSGENLSFLLVFSYPVDLNIIDNIFDSQAFVLVFSNSGIWAQDTTFSRYGLVAE